MLCPEWASSYKGCVNTVTGCVAPPVSPSRVFNQQWRCGCCYTSRPLEQDFYSDILPPRLLLHTLDPKYWNTVQLLVQEYLFHLAYHFIYRLHCLLLVQPRSLWLTKSPNIFFIPAVGTKWMGQKKFFVWSLEIPCSVSEICPSQWTPAVIVFLSLFGWQVEFFSLWKKELLSGTRCWRGG